ncbi:ABC transporter transmembrane domain-containing protein [Parvularcula lutaonensis]|uniref:ABC transporter transmembrane domain-containing protein n=1 Tax=Parvularcula lutaonensis TaxID=491923 RepID=A0ABV7MBQ0_9PROT|nr:ABC transporter transmembrane domain-containing protein [Parvularcula lutaonensis]GGY48888.1 ABC transporter [Parvularcula lutaonensis]
MADREQQADIDRGSSFASELARDREHREKARTAKPLRKLVPFILRYPGLLAAFIVFLALAALLTLTLPAAFRLVVDCGFGGAESSPACSSLPIGDDLSAYFIAGIAVAFALGVVSALRYYFISRLGERVVADLRTRVYSHLLGLSPGFYAQVRTGEVLSRLTTDTTLIQTVVGSSISVAIRTLVTTLGALVLMVIVSWKLALLVLLGAPVVIGPIMLFGRRVQRLSRSSQDRLADASARASETLRAIETVQAFTREDEERRRFSEAVEATFNVALRRIRVRAFMTATIFSVILSGLIGVLWFGAVQVQSGAISPGSMAQFVMYAFIAVSGVGLLTETYAEIMRAAGATERLMELLSSKDTLPVARSPQPLKTPVEGRIGFEEVRFAYPTRPEIEALAGVSFRVEPGETVALVGRSGAGKSTILQLILRFYDPASGRVTLDGNDLRDLDPKALRSQLSVVQQNAPLFSGTVAENIRFARPDATDAEVRAAAKAANAHSFIEALPQGYDTMLGEDGSTLSGGQRQRIAIARAILRDTPVLLLDEATSALDSESEAAIKAALASITASKTTVVIAHRLSTVMNANKIIVLDQGKVIATGTHDQLIKEGGIYAQLAELQFGASVVPETESA